MPDMDQTVGATFGDALRLLGYDLERGDDEIRITLPQGRYWLGAGVCHPDMGARLLVVEAPVSLDGSDGRLLLLEMIER